VPGCRGLTGPEPPLVVGGGLLVATSAARNPVRARSSTP
jgi:hypothetical protein